MQVLFLLAALLVSVCSQEVDHRHISAVRGHHREDDTLTFEVEAKSRRCIFELVSEKDKEINVNFQVIRGGLLDIKVKVEDPDGVSVIERLAFFNKVEDVEKAREGEIILKDIKQGEYEICFDNMMSRWTPKVVTVYTHHVYDIHEDLHDGLAKLTDLGNTVDSVIAVADKLDEVEKIQKQARLRETRHRDFLEMNNARVAWIPILESVVMIIVSVFQLFYIRNMFSDTKASRV
jgi:hypothetical protein